MTACQWKNGAKCTLIPKVSALGFSVSSKKGKKLFCISLVTAAGVNFPLVSINLFY